MKQNVQNFHLGDAEQVEANTETECADRASRTRRFGHGRRRWSWVRATRFAAMDGDEEQKSLVVVRRIRKSVSLGAMVGSFKMIYIYSYA